MVSTHPMGLPPEEAKLEGRPPGRLFEYLRQAVLQRSAKEFNDLPLQIKAAARIGGLIYTERATFLPRIYHVLADGSLLGILDRRKGQFFIRRQIQSEDLSDLHAVMRPQGAEASGRDLEQIPVQDLVWQYGQHDPEALLDLPTEIGTHWLHLRKLPNVSPSLLQERHLALIRLLLVREQLFDQLLKQTPKQDHSKLMRDVASMVLTRSVDSLPSDAVHASRRMGEKSQAFVIKR
ncbi:MAG: hypothetical protein HC858_13500 [Brachymonas sp.]|nr:hypothetical protein [Brachymonas sp.]